MVVNSRPASRRTLSPLSALLALLAVAALGASVSLASFGPELVRFLPVAVAMVVVGFSTGAVAPRVDWSFGIALGYGGLAMSAASDAPLVAVVLAAMMAYSEVERREADLARYISNLSQLVLAGFVAGVVFESLRPVAVGPSLAVVVAVAVASACALITNLLLVTGIAWYGYGRASLDGVVRGAAPLVWRTVLLAVAVGVVASTVNLLGPAWIVVVMVLTVTLAALPLIKMRTEAQRAALLATVTAALNVRGVVNDSDGRLERTAVDAGQRLHFDAKRIEQLRYVILLYLATDNYTGTLPRSIDDQLRDPTESATSSSALLFGLPLSDLADQTVIRLAEAAAEFDALRFPPDGGAGLGRDEALAELERAGIRPDIVAALASRQQVSDAYLRAWRLNPEFVWRTPRLGLARRL